MPKSALKVALPPPPRTPEREALADAIERRTAAERRLADARAAEVRRQDASFAASRVQKAATVALAQATAAEPRRLVAEFTGNAGGLPSVKDAAAAVDGANAEVERLRGAREALVEEERDGERELDTARRVVDLCVQEVVRAEYSIAEVLAAAQRTQAALVAQRVVLRHLLGSGLVAEAEGGAVHAFLRENSLPGAPPYGGLSGSVEYQDWSCHAAAAPWHELVATLARDADAPLPVD